MDLWSVSIHFSVKEKVNHVQVSFLNTKGHQNHTDPELEGGREGTQIYLGFRVKNGEGKPTLVKL